MIHLVAYDFFQRHDAIHNNYAIIVVIAIEAKVESTQTCTANGGAQI
jgi:hypothetical protein